MSHSNFISQHILHMPMEWMNEFAGWGVGG
jgi:hypothetical protein